MDIFLKNKAKINKKLLFSTVLNYIIVILEIYSISISARNKGYGMFRFYTDNSNMFALFACFLLAMYQTISLLKNKDITPMWVKNLKYYSTCCVALTFIIVACFLAPLCGINGIVIMFTYNSMFYHHLICPLLVVISFMFFEKYNFKHNIIYKALIPTLGYGIVILILNLLKVVRGPYPFLFVYELPVWSIVLFMIAIVLLAFSLNWIIWRFNKKLSNR